MVEGTPLLREHTGQNLYPGFESLRLRQCLFLPTGSSVQACRPRSGSAMMGATLHANRNESSRLVRRFLLPTIGRAFSRLETKQLSPTPAVTVPVR